MRTVSALVLLALCTTGCGLLHDPCGDLEDRLCTDLGPDCATFMNDASLRETLIPTRRRKAERAQCEMFVADANYSSYTLPYARYLVQHRRDPRVRMPSLPAPRAVDGLASGIGSWLWVVLPLIVVPGIFIYSWHARRKLMAMHGAPMAPLGGWAAVDTRDKAEALARTGALVPVELLPRAMGGMPVPENVVFVPPAAAAQKAALDQQVLAWIQQGHSVPYAVEPQYRGASFVPAALVVRAGDRTETVYVW